MSTPLVITIAGAPVLAQFRRERRLARLQALNPSVTALDAQYVYFVAMSSQPNAQTVASLGQILNEGIDYSELTQGWYFDVAPRAGTISPWSSKATDIAAHCEIDGVLRIERGVRYQLTLEQTIDAGQSAALAACLHDRMTESCFAPGIAALELFASQEPRALGKITLGADPQGALAAANSALGLALSDDEMGYLAKHYARLARDPTDAELMMFAQANSEHCRHKIFNADWVIDGEVSDQTLFGMIRNTTSNAPEGVISAYSDNAAVLAGSHAARLFADPDSHAYTYHAEDVDILIKVETHNHPTAISPFPGAATGAGGEIRDEGATGLGAVPKAGLTGFSVSNLDIPDFPREWETAYGKPGRIVSALDIMLEGPLGGAAFNNEFGRPNLGGYFRTFQAPRGENAESIWGYHKPIMIAGGMGNVRRQHALKQEVPAGSCLIVLGGPAMLIGLGGGAASSLASGSSDEALDFASVQRGNPEMQRRAQEVINRCWARGDDSPIILIHDVGAGGLSNAVPEAVDHSQRGGRFELRAVPCDEPDMSPMEIWCNEAQERYVLIVARERLAEFADYCTRERCPHAVLGEITNDGRLLVADELLGESAVDLPMNVLLGKPPKMSRDVTRVARVSKPFDTSALDVGEAIRRVLSFPTVADKSFLIHIGDRTVGGLTARDQLIGPWQVPVSDVAVTTSTHASLTGEAMAMGERTPVAVTDSPTAARLAVSEALTNILAADVAKLSDIKLSANWMAAAGEPGEDAALYDAVQAVGLEFCPQLGIAIPVGKDSLSMQTTWADAAGAKKQVVAPVSLIVTAFAPVTDVRKTLTPQLQAIDDSRLLLLDLGEGDQGLGQSCLAQVFAADGGRAAQVMAGDEMRTTLTMLIALKQDDKILAYHDRSDGGVLAAAAEMMFASRLGVDLQFAGSSSELIGALFNEAPGILLQVAAADVAAVCAAFAGRCSEIGQVVESARLQIQCNGETIYSKTRGELQLFWSETSFRMQAMRDNPTTAAESFQQIADDTDPGLHAKLTFDVNENIASARINSGAKPRVAILREQGVNSYLEMAAAFIANGFDAVDVHMSDLADGRVKLADFNSAVACGGFSFGDVLGAGGGWAKSILLVPQLRDQFAAFFADPNTLSLGVCNGCQMMAQLSSLIPGAQDWPVFKANRSEQFEARLSLVEVAPSPSILLAGMHESRMPIATSHGEGRASFTSDNARMACAENQLVALRYVDNHGQTASLYPANPNGSPEGICALTTPDGRVTITMPHPERVYRTVQNSWHPADWGEQGAWARMFANARLAFD